MKFLVECPCGGSQCQVTLIYSQPVTKISRSKKLQAVTCTVVV